MEVFDQTSLRGGRRPWQDLPPELLGLVLQRVPSYAGRVSLSAVCRSWHAGAGMQPPLPPLLPLLLQRDDTFLSLPDSAVHRFAVPDNVACLMSTGSMLFLAHGDGDGKCSLFDPFSQVTAHQYVDAECFSSRISSRDTIVYNVRKVVIMSDHVISMQKIHNQYEGVLSIRRRRRQSMTRTVEVRWKPPVVAYSFDATLFQEKLHVLVITLVGTIDLYVMNLISDEHVNLQRILSKPIDNFLPPFGHSYLVGSGDRLLMVRQGISKFNNKRIAAQFEVYEASDLNIGRAQWRKVDSLMGRALFLSAGYSASLPAGDRYGEAREDCIYFLSELDNRDFRQESLSSGIYNIREGTLSPLPSDMMVAQDGPGTASWFFPIIT